MMNRRKFLKHIAAPFAAAFLNFPLIATSKPKTEYFDGPKIIFKPEHIKTGLNDPDINIMEEIAKATGIPVKLLIGPENGVDNHGN